MVRGLHSPLLGTPDDLEQEDLDDGARGEGGGQPERRARGVAAADHEEELRVAWTGGLSFCTVICCHSYY